MTPLQSAFTILVLVRRNMVSRPSLVLSELEFVPDGKILSYCHCGMPLLVRVDPYYQVSLSRSRSHHLLLFHILNVRFVASGLGRLRITTFVRIIVPAK